MIALFMLIAIAFYFTLSFFIVIAVYKIFGTKKARHIAIAVMILIPTWDVILGYPIYKLLCWTSAGVQIYKTVDNVEGFYVGEKNKYGNPAIVLPYTGYDFIDYKDGKNGMYYQNRWIDTNTSRECVPYKGAWNHNYTEAFKKGKCIVKKEISESEVSRWEYIKKSKSKTTTSSSFLSMKIDSTISLVDTKKKELLSEVVSVVWKGGWIYGFLASIPVSDNWKVRCPRIIDINYDVFLNTSLKPKDRNDNGNS